MFCKKEMSIYLQMSRSCAGSLCHCISSKSVSFCAAIWTWSLSSCLNMETKHVGHNSECTACPVYALPCMISEHSRRSDFWNAEGAQKVMFIISPNITHSLSLSHCLTWANSNSIGELIDEIVQQQTAAICAQSPVNSSFLCLCYESLFRSFVFFVFLS